MREAILSGFGSGGYGAKTYGKLGLETEIVTAEPHRLVLMLFDGALLSIRRAKSHMAERNIPEKCRAIGNAIEIVDSGLRVSVDPKPDPIFAGRLVSLYQYIVMRLLQGNLRNDVAALDEAARLLGDLRGAWIQIGPQRPQPQVAEPQSAAAPRAAAPGLPRQKLAAYQA
jgi:flagellar protein FliS